MKGTQQHFVNHDPQGQGQKCKSGYSRWCTIDCILVFHAFVVPFQIDCCRLLTFFKINFFKKALSETLSQCQTVWIQIRTDILLVLIWESSNNVFFLVLNLFYSFTEGVNGYFKENCNFQGFIFQGVQLFPGGGGGVQMLISIETHITCDFPGGVQAPYPPSRSAHVCTPIIYRITDI